MLAKMKIDERYIVNETKILDLLNRRADEIKSSDDANAYLIDST